MQQQPPDWVILYRVPARFREAAEMAVRAAVDAPASSCTHVGTDWMICGRHPTAGSFCPDCGGYRHIEDLLTDESCTLCGGEGASKLGVIPHGDYEVLARWCDGCARGGRGGVS